MRYLAYAVFLVSAASCGGPRKPPPPPIASSAPSGSPDTTEPPALTSCDQYFVILDQARHTPPTVDDSVHVPGYNACGCQAPFYTTADAAVRVAAAYDEWHTRGCGPISCDTPCPR